MGLQKEEGGKEGRKERRREGRKEERKEGKKEASKKKKKKEGRNKHQKGVFVWSEFWSPFFKYYLFFPSSLSFACVSSHIWLQSGVLSIRVSEDDVSLHQ